MALKDNKYFTSKFGKKDMSFNDITDMLAFQGARVEFAHVASGVSAAFKAFVTGYEDSYTSDWSDQTVYGRMDPIKTFQGTRRVISLSWNLVASTAFEAVDNMNEVSKLITMLYPVYDEEGVMAASPMIKMKFMNLVADAASPDGGVFDSGLVGSVSGFTHSPDTDFGYFDGTDGTIPKHAVMPDPYARGEIYPKVISMDCEFTVFHTKPVGFGKKQTEDGALYWRGTDKFTPTSFPYGMGHVAPTARFRPTEVADATTDPSSPDAALAVATLDPTTGTGDE